MKNNRLSVIFSKYSYTYFIIGLTLFVFVTKLMAGTAFHNNVDIINYNLSWMNSLKDGLFDVYSRDMTIDYPPVFLILLYPLSGLLNIPVVAADRHLIMLVLKTVPILFDCMIIPMLWFVLKKRSPKAGIIAASLWAVNSSMMINSTLWGQTDSIMAFFLLLCFYLLDSDRAILGGVMFGIACVTKYQSLYFAPVVFMQLVTGRNIKKLLLSVAAGIAAGAAVFLPFMIGSHDMMLVPELYLGGFDKYNFATLNAANIYAVLGLNIVPTDYSFSDGVFGVYAPFLKHINIGTFSMVMMILCIVGIVVLYITAKNRSVWVFSILFMQCIFMFTSKMHERYQFIVVPLCLMFAYLADDVRFLIAHVLLTATTAMNQFILIVTYNNTVNDVWYLVFDKMLFCIAVINLIVFVYTAYICISYCYRTGGKKSRLNKTADEVNDEASENENSVDTSTVNGTSVDAAG